MFSAVQFSSVHVQWCSVGFSTSSNSLVINPPMVTHYLANVFNSVKKLLALIKNETDFRNATKISYNNWCFTYCIILLTAIAKLKLTCNYDVRSHIQSIVNIDRQLERCQIKSAIIIELYSFTYRKFSQNTQYFTISCVVFSLYHFYSTYFAKVFADGFQLSISQSQ